MNRPVSRAQAAQLDDEESAMSAVRDVDFGHTGGKDQAAQSLRLDYRPQERIGPGTDPGTTKGPDASGTNGSR